MHVWQTESLSPLRLIWCPSLRKLRRTAIACSALLLVCCPSRCPLRPCPEQRPGATIISHLGSIASSLSSVCCSDLRQHMYVLGISTSMAVKVSTSRGSNAGYIPVDVVEPEYPLGRSGVVFSQYAQRSAPPHVDVAGKLYRHVQQV